MKHIFSGLMLLALYACNSSTLHTVGSDWELTNATVESVSERPAASGILSTFVEIEAKSESNSMHLLLLPYFGENQVIPDESSVCNFKGKWDHVEGSSMKNAELSRSRKYRVVSEFACDGQTHKNDYY